MTNQSNKQSFPAFNVTGLKDIEKGIDVLESFGTAELVNEGGVGRIVVSIAHLGKIVENGEEFVGVLTLFELFEKWDGCAELVSCGLVRPPRLLFGFVVETGMEGFRWNESRIELIEVVKEPHESR